MMIDPYVAEKLRQLEAEHALRRLALKRASGRTPTLAPLARLSGRALRRLGERLELWATAPEPTALPGNSEAD